MTTTKLLKTLLAESYETENNLVDLIKECFEEIFKDKAQRAYAMFEEDLEAGRQWNGCLQSLQYYHNEIKRDIERMDAVKKMHDQTKE